MFSAVAVEPLVPRRAFHCWVIWTPSGSGQETAHPSTPVPPAVTTTSAWNQFCPSEVQWLVTRYVAEHALAGIGSGGSTPPAVGVWTGAAGCGFGVRLGVGAGVGVGVGVSVDGDGSGVGDAEGSGTLVSSRSAAENGVGTRLTSAGA